jgi:hypothetical protein
MEDVYSEDKLTSILELMKNRREIDHPVNYDAIRESSTYLQDGILIKLMKYISSSLETINSLKLLDSSEMPNEPANVEKMEKINWNLLKLSAEVIFFALYQTQVEVEEAKLLLEVIHTLSDSLAKTVDDFGSGASAGSLPTNSASNLFNFKNQMITSLLYVLNVLQLAHVCAHQQIAKLLNRRKNYFNAKSFAEMEPGNLLPQKRGSKYGLDKNHWKCSGAKGFANLVFAVFRQPEVDDGKAPKEDVEWFMHEACVLRAYSYIRLVVLPFIQTSSVIRYEYSLFYTAVIAELLENLAKVFVFSHYEHHENDFPYIFFPPTMDFYLQNIHFYHSILEEYSHSRASPYKRTPQMQQQQQQMSHSNISDPSSVYEIDTLQDVLSLFIDLLNYYPSFATIFWGEVDENEADNDNDEGGDDAAVGGHASRATSNFLQEFHPFISKVMESAQHHRHLLLDTLRLLTALANGPKGCTAKFIYSLVAEGYLSNKLDWAHIFEKINRFINEFLGGQDENSNRNMLSANLPVAGVLSGGNPLNNNENYQRTTATTTTTTTRQISAIDLEGILVFTELIGAVVVKKSVAIDFVQHHQLLVKLFNLLSCPIPIEIKGSVLVVLANLALHAHFTSELWELLDSSGLFSGMISSLGLNNTGASGGGISQENRLTLVAPPRVGGGVGGPSMMSSFSRGIKAELEENESRSGRYPVTNGFLCLIRNLLTHGLTIPNELGLGNNSNSPDNNIASSNLTDSTVPRRIPGIIPYLEFIIDDILLKSHERFYSPDTNLNILTQKWRITCRCLEIFNLILQGYPLESYNLSLFNSAAASKEFFDSNTIQADPLLADFFEEFSFYELPSSLPNATAAVNQTNAANKIRYRRPKTAGFYLLATFLNNTKLMEFLIKILQVINYSYLMQSSKYYTTNELLLIQEVYKYAFVNHKLRSKLSFLFYEKHHFTNYIKTTSSAVPGVGAGYDLVVQDNVSASYYHLSNAKRDSLSTNTVSWIERTLSMTINVLYEISLRESNFRALFKLSSQSSLSMNAAITPSPLYLTKYNFKKGGSAAHLQQVPLHPYPFSDILINYSIPNLLIHFVSMEYLTLPMLPMMNIVIMKIIEFILLQKPFHSLLSQDSFHNSFEMGTSSSKTSGNPANQSNTKGLDAKQILENFIYCILNEKEFPPFLYEETSLKNTFYNIFYQGGEKKPFHSKTLLSFLPENNNENSLLSSALSTANNNNNSCYGSLREATLSLMLNTFVNNPNTFIHFLLGFSPKNNNTNNMPSSSSSIFASWNPSAASISSSQLVAFEAPSSTGNNNNNNINNLVNDCFDAMLDLISPTHNKNGSHSFLKSPKTSLIVYELIYHLSLTSTANNSTSLRTFERLNKKSFLTDHLSYFYFLMKLSKEEFISLLLELDLFPFLNGNGGGGGGSNKDEQNQRMLSKLLDYQIMITHAVSLLMKIFSNELSLLFSSATSSNSSSTTTTTTATSLLYSSSHYETIKSMIQLLFHQYFVVGISSSAANNDTSNYGTRDEQIGLVQLLSYSFQDDLMNSLMKEVIQDNQILEEVEGEGEATNRRKNNNNEDFGELQGIEGIQFLSSHKQFPQILQCMKESMYFESSSLRKTSTATKSNMHSPSYRVINIDLLTNKLKDVFQFSSISSSTLNNNNTTTNYEFLQEAIKETEFIIRFTIQLSILFNQQEKLNASRQHLISSVKNFVDCSFILMMSPLLSTALTTANTSSPSSSVAYMTKVFYEIQETNSYPDLQKYIFLELLLPLVRFMKVNYYEINSSSSSASSSNENSSMKENLIKTVLVLLKFCQQFLISSSSSSSSSPILKEEEIRLFSFSMKELMENLYFLLSNSTTVLNYQFIKNYSLQEMIRMKLFSFNSSSSSSASANNNVMNDQMISFRGYLAVALNLALNLFSSSSSSGGSEEKKMITRSSVLKNNRNTMNDDFENNNNNEAATEEKNSFSSSSAVVMNEIQKQVFVSVFFFNFLRLFLLLTTPFFTFRRW